MNAVVLGCAYAMDLIVGDPEWFPHPVRAIGRMISAGEAMASPGRHAPVRDLIQGAIVAVGVVVATAVAAMVALRAVRAIHPGVAPAVEVLLAWTVLATGSLLSEANRVIRALDSEDIVSARVRLARIVGRDTATLTASEIARGVIETLAESTCDAIVAPLCFLVVGGVPAALAYKAVNTLDSMVGHREPPYTYFGRVAARLDDVANYIPARLAGLTIALAAPCTGGNFAGALRVWRRDHANHDSPNAGHPEAAMAGALGVRLGGTNYYDGIAAAKPLLDAESPAPTIAAARAACRNVTVASLIAVVAGLVVVLTWRL
jgi:adenosylcobinamide-phosphate synthase